MAKKNKKVTIDDLQEGQLLGNVMSRYQKSQAFFEKYLNNNDTWYAQYRNISTAPSNEYRSQVTIPVGFWTIETTVPRMVSKPHEFIMTVRNTKNMEAVAHATQAHAYYDYLLDQMHIQDKTEILAKDMKIFGNGFWKYGWDSAAEEPFILNIPLRLLRIDPSANEPGNLQKCRYIIQILDKTVDEVKHDPKYAEGLKGFDWENLGNTEDTSTETNRNRKTRLSMRGLQTDIKDPGEKTVEIMEQYGWIEGTRRLITVMNKQKIIRNIEWKHDFWPFALAVNTQDPDNILGIGDIEPVSDLIKDVNDNRRLRTDNKNIRTNVMFERIRSAGVRDEELQWRPGGVIDSSIPNGITPIAIPDTTGGSLEQELHDLNTIEKATNTPAQIQGQLKGTSDSGGLLNRTATAFAGAQQETNVRFKYQSKNLDRAVEETLTNLWKIIQEHTHTEQVAKVVGEDDSRKFVEIPLEAIKQEYIIDIKFGSSALEDQQKLREEAMVKLQTLSNIYPESAELFVKDFLIAMGDKNIDEVVQIIAAQRKATEEQGNLPKPPQINVSLGGEDVNPIVTNEILGQYFPLSKVATDPALHPDTRLLMFGQTPEALKREELELEKDKVKIEMFRAITDAQATEKQLSNEQVKITADILNNEEQNAQSRQTTTTDASEKSNVEGTEETTGE